MPSPLESFVLEYVENAGGAWDALEPQVYDVMVPPQLREELDLPSGDIARLAFDPEALAEHPNAQLMMFGNPVLERMFAAAQAQGQIAGIYLPPGNLTPHDLHSSVRRSLSLPPKTELSVESTRIYHFRSAIFWFEATYISDEKEQDILAVGVERYYGRLARHLEEIVRSADPEFVPSVPYPDAPCLPLAQTYALAREEALRSVQVAAHARLAELQAGLERQMARMSTYFGDLRAEARQRVVRSGADEEALAKLQAQEQAIEREEQARLAELRQKLALRVQVRLLNLLHVVQPKLKLVLLLERPKSAPTRLEAIWDPLGQVLEPLACPACGRPTLSLVAGATRPYVCPACTQEATAGRG